MHDPFKNETKLKANNLSTYSEKYMNPIVHDLVIANQRFLKPFVELFDYSTERKTENVDNIVDQHGPQETGELEELVNNNNIDYELQVEEEIYFS